jgi:hypothetical protein
MRRLALIVMALALVGSAAGIALAAEMTVTGELVDHACYTKRGAEDGSGSGHAQCAKDCAMKGMPVALVTAGGDVYMLSGGVTADNNAALVPHMSHTVEVTGDVSESGSVKTITADAIKHISAG